MAPRMSSLPGLWKYPSRRDDPLKSALVWLEGKREDDGAEGLWRVHDCLYDLSDWQSFHPGGEDWIKYTKGTDITEAFETHHISGAAESLLKKFYVREAKTRRNSPYTFDENGFYKTLKRRVLPVLAKVPKTEAAFSANVADVLLMLTLFTSALAGRFESLLLGTVAGIFLTLTAICSHNFFHQKDNFRMYYFNLTFLSYREWRISHALSHHLYPNTLLDLEISLFEPFFEYLPKPKTVYQRFGSWLLSPIVYSLLFYIQLLTRLNQKRLNLEREDFIPLAIPLIMLLGGGTSIISIIGIWLWQMAVTSFLFIAIGVNAAHHHPDLFHDGDTPRPDFDWGIQQLDAVRDRPLISKSTVLALVTFGHHGLHHLFPTIDHSLLHKIYPIFNKTCKEFGIRYDMMTQVELIKGQFQQLARTSVRLNPPGQDKIK